MLCVVISPSPGWSRGGALANIRELAELVRDTGGQPA
jgi:hypothetical protein